MYAVYGILLTVCTLHTHELRQCARKLFFPHKQYTAKHMTLLFTVKLHYTNLRAKIIYIIAACMYHFILSIADHIHAKGTKVLYICK